MKTAENRDVWTPERVSTLRKLWSDGVTAEEIGVKIGGLTKNAVVGKINRLGLAKRYKPDTERALHGYIKPKPKFDFATKAAKAKPRTIQPEPYVSRETVVTPEHLRISFEDLDDKRCKYAHGDNPPYAFCGAKVVPTTSWCPTHFAKVFGTAAPEGTGGFTQQVSENIGELEGAV